jgi:hypothetical protein
MSLSIICNVASHSWPEKWNAVTIKVTFTVEDTVDKEDSSDSLDSEPPGDKLRFLRFLRGRPFRFGAETVKFICIIHPKINK